MWQRLRTKSSQGQWWPWAESLSPFSSFLFFMLTAFWCLLDASDHHHSMAHAMLHVIHSHSVISFCETLLPGGILITRYPHTYIPLGIRDIKESINELLWSAFFWKGIFTGSSEDNSFIQRSDFSRKGSDSIASAWGGGGRRRYFGMFLRVLRLLSLG